MGQGKKTAADLYRIDLYQLSFRVWPLFGLNRMVKLAHRKRNGVLYCDNVMCVSESLTFAENNTQNGLHTMSHRSPLHVGVRGEPRLNVPNEASAADLQRYHDDGSEAVFSFTPQAGKTYSMETDVYKTFDSGHRYVRGHLPENAWIERWEMTLDVSAYLRSGYSDSGEPPRCLFESVATGDRGHEVRGTVQNLVAVEKGTGLWGWHVDKVEGGTYRLAWELELLDELPAYKTVNLERLATELSIDQRLAKDLHNFVMICHYYVAGFRSLNKIGPQMMTDESVLRRGIESVERAVGAELFQRTRGKGLISVTPAGETVLDWWSLFYMRWTPIAPEPVG